MAISKQASHCFEFERDFIGNWRCIPLCVRRKLDLIGLKLKLSHWLECSSLERQELVDWADDPSSLERLRSHLRDRTCEMADGMAQDLSPAKGEPWQQTLSVPDRLVQASETRGLELSLHSWCALQELERFALCKLARPGHDHHNLDAAFSEVLT